MLDYTGNVTIKLKNKNMNTDKWNSNWTRSTNVL